VTSSLRQIAANRRNAEKSTGPTTPEGKERSRCNAVRHGLTAETVIAGLEDAEDYQAFEEAVTADYNVETAVERELVLRLASVLWRLRRATGIESALFESVINQSKSPKPDPVIEIASLSEQSRLVLVEGREPDDVSPRTELAINAKSRLAAAFLGLSELPTFPLDRLSRYEHLLWRQARQLVLTLESLGRRNRKPSHSSFPFSFRRRELDALSEESK
jgi:hypothetical protein